MARTSQLAGRTDTNTISPEHVKPVTARSAAATRRGKLRSAYLGKAGKAIPTQSDDGRNPIFDTSGMFDTRLRL